MFLNLKCMKSLYPRFSRIALKDWLEYHPYDGEVITDHFYIDLCNDIQHELLHIDVNDYLVGADYKYLSCVLACYFEDTVSRTGIWTSFIDQHHKLYGKYLPFYDMTGYGRGEINLADIQFLIWHFCSNLSIQAYFLDPYSIEKTEIAQVLYDMLNDTVELAPVNEDLKAALELAPDADINTVREHLDFFFFGCYFHHYYTSTLLEEEKLDVKNQKGGQIEIDNRRNNLLFNRVSPLLAQYSGEILARWLGEAHPLYDNLMSLSKRKEGFFLYEGATSNHLQMKHIASGTSIELNHPDWKFSLTAGKTIVRMGVVQWGGEWYVAGPVFPTSDSLHEKIPDKEKYLFSPVASHLGVIIRAEECFLEVNDNSRIVFLDSKRDAFFFIDHIWETYHLKFGMDSMDRKMYDVHTVTFDVDEDMDNLVVFFNSRTGMEFYPDIAQCISDKYNIYFEKDAETKIEDLILSDRVSSDFIAYLIENKMIEVEPAVGKKGFHYITTNYDFLLRYWKKERYLTEPKIFVE